MQDIIDNKWGVQITQDEVRKATFKQENNKASGPDEISAEIIKSSYVVVSIYLVSIFNNLLNISEYSESLSPRYIVPTMKGDTKIAKHFLGITLNII